MQILQMTSFPLDRSTSTDPVEERLGNFCYGREFPMRFFAHSTRFPMHEPIARLRADHGATERLYVRVTPLRVAIDNWSRAVGSELAARTPRRRGALADAEESSGDDQALVPYDAAGDDQALVPQDTDTAPRRFTELDLTIQLALCTPLAPALATLPGELQAALATALALPAELFAACRTGQAAPDQWEAFIAAMDRTFWRIPWAQQTAEMYALMEARVLRAVQYHVVTWEPADVSEMAIRVSLSAATQRPVQRATALPAFITGTYRERLRYLEPQTYGEPYLAVLTSYDCAGEWDATLFHELISLPIDSTIAVDVQTLNRNKSQRVAEMAYNAAKLVARDQNLVDLRGEQVVVDARDVLSQLKGQTLHAIQVAILVRGRTLEELEANIITVRDLFGPRLKLMRAAGAQGVTLKIFSTIPLKRIDAPWKPRTQLSKVVGCAVGMVGFHRPNQTRGVFVGVDRNGRFPIFINLFERNQAAHMIIAGMTGFGKTVLLNLLAERAASVGNMQVIGIDAFKNGERVERAVQDCVCFTIGLEHSVNVLDVIYGWESEGGWENNQIMHAVAQIALLLGKPGKNRHEQTVLLPLPLEDGTRGVLSLAVKRLYRMFRVTPDTPTQAMPILSDLIAVLEAMQDPLADGFALRLRYLIYGSSAATDEKTPEGVTFDAQTTIKWDFTNAIVYYDFKDVPDIWLSFFYLEALNAVWRYARTRPRGRNIFLMIDEFGHASQNEAVAHAAWVIAKTARKYGLGIVLVDQTMRPFLDTMAGRQIHANAAAHFFFHMQDIEAMEIAEAMSVLTPRNVQFITTSEPGQCLGVIRKDAYEINVECHPKEAHAFLNS